MIFLFTFGVCDVLLTGNVKNLEKYNSIWAQNTLLYK